MAFQESRNHHFVPKLLLRPWLIEGSTSQSVLCGYWWDRRRKQMRCKRRGLNSFCFQLDLLSLSAHRQGRDAIEKVFFGEIDTKGVIARDILLTHGPAKLTEDQRCDFARLLLSLEARRPVTVERLRADGPAHFARELDADPEIRAAMAEHGFDVTPSSYVEDQLDWCFEDRSLAVIQELTDNPKVGQRLINAHWAVKDLGAHDGSLVLSDRPLIRIHGYDRPGATWVLPLTPKAAFIAANDRSNLSRLLRLTAQRFAKRTNVSSASQAERFVFAVETWHERWLPKYLKHTS